MTAVMGYSSGPRMNLGTYIYTSEPRTLAITGSNRRSTSKSGRVIRGTNFGKDGAPKWNPYFAYARCLSANDYALSQLDSSVSAEVAVIKALVSNILREAAVEVAAEAEADGVKMEQLAARRLSADGAKNETTDEIRKDPEGEEAPPETTEEEIAPDPPEEEPAPADEEKEEADIDLPEPDEVIGKGDLTEPEEVPAG